MDFDKWKDLFLGLVALAGGGKLFIDAAQRRKSKDKLVDAENSVGANYVQGLEANVREATQQAKVNYEMFIAEQRRADKLSFQVETNTAELERLNRLREHDLADKKRLTQQVDQLTRVVVQMGVPVDEKLRLQETGFGGLAR